MLDARAAIIIYVFLNGGLIYSDFIYLFWDFLYSQNFIYPTFSFIYPFTHYTWIWETAFFPDVAGSLMGILMVSSQLVTTIERRAEYSVWIIESSTDQNLKVCNSKEYINLQHLWNWSIFSYHPAAFSISKSGWFPTQWSRKFRPT